jgi:signal peptidase II
MTRGRRTSLAIFLVAMLSCLGCDQFTKAMARTHLDAGSPIPLAFGTVQLTLVENAGAFMSLGASLPESVRRTAFQIVVPLLLLVLCVGFLRNAAMGRADVFAVALLAGGGAGNWLDRVLREGTVTDFIRVGWGPVHSGIFNAADVAILLGAGMLAMRLMARDEELPPERADPA